MRRSSPLPAGPFGLLRHILATPSPYGLGLRLRCWAVAHLAYALIGHIGWTLRLRCLHRQRELYFLARGRPVVYAVWHQAIFFLIWRMRWRRGICMASRSRFGEVADYITRLSGNHIARGGSSRGGKHKGGSEALDEMSERVLREGLSTGALVDASLGPPFVCKWGVVELARRTGAPLIPMAADARWKIHLGTWDRTIIPAPGSEAVVAYGEPLYVAPDIDRRRMLEIAEETGRRILALQDEVDRALGRQRPDPRTRPGDAQSSVPSAATSRSMSSSEL